MKKVMRFELGEKVVASKLVTHVGYEKSMYDLMEHTLPEDAVLPLNMFELSEDTRQQVRKALSKAQGAERKWFFLDPANTDLIKVYTIIGVKRFWTGRYVPACCETDDYTPAYLSDQKMISLYEVRASIYDRTVLYAFEEHLTSVQRKEV